MKTINKTLLAAAITLGLVTVGGVAAVYSGAYNVAADAPHTRLVHALLATTRDRSIATRAAGLHLPADLGDAERIRQGAGNYDAMCAGCHLAPGAEETELSKGLYPAPPNLSKETAGAARAFWTIKHGIKASGMPAWGKSMGDEYLWNMAAFVQELPALDPAAYAALVAGSGGHAHGGGETGGHADADGGGDHHDATDGDDRHDAASEDHHGSEAHGDDDSGHEGMTETPAAPAPAAGKTHDHADGKVHTHAPTPAAPGKPATDPTTADEASVGIPHAGMAMSAPAATAAPAHDDDGHDHPH